MHFITLLLLAVHVNGILAGVARHGPSLRSGLHVRSFNQSAVDAAARQPHDSGDPEKQIGSVPAAGSGPGAANIDEEDLVSANTVPPAPLTPTLSENLSTVTASVHTSAVDRENEGSPVITSKQIGRVPAVGSGPEAATLPAGEIASASTKPPTLVSADLPAPSSSLPSPTNSAPSSAGDGEDAVTVTSKQVGIVPAVGSGPGAATSLAVEVASAITDSPKSFVSTNVVFVTTTLGTAPKATSSVQSSTANTITTDADAGTSNIVMAANFNQFFDLMNANSLCDPEIDTQRMVCIDKKQARCGADGRYTLTACSQNLICRAVPLADTQTGIAVKCVPNADLVQSSPSKAVGSGSGQPTIQVRSTVMTTQTVPVISASSSSRNGPPEIIFTTETRFITSTKVTPKKTPSTSSSTTKQPGIVIIPVSRISVASTSSTMSDASTTRRPGLVGAFLNRAYNPSPASHSFPGAPTTVSDGLVAAFKHRAQRPTPVRLVFPGASTTVRPGLIGAFQHRKDPASSTSIHPGLVGAFQHPGPKPTSTPVPPGLVRAFKHGKDEVVSMTVRPGFVEAFKHHQEQQSRPASPSSPRVSVEPQSTSSAAPPPPAPPAIVIIPVTTTSPASTSSQPTKHSHVVPQPTTYNPHNSP